MMRGFHRSHLAYLRCPQDDGALALSPAEAIVRDGVVRCQCGFSAPIRKGILILVKEALHAECRREWVLRDVEYQSGTPEKLTPRDRMEFQPTLRELRLTGQNRLLELGAGSGRYTLQLTNSCSDIVAVDLSLKGLRRISERPRGTARVSLVQADIAKFSVSKGSFDRALSTLTSNLPSRELRRKVLSLAAKALDPNQGIFVWGAHHWGALAKREGQLREGFYNGTGIYRYHMTVEEMREEAGEFFEKTAARPIVIFPPGGLRLRLPLVALEGILEYVPVIRGYGSLALGIARKPRSQVQVYSELTGS